MAKKFTNEDLEKLDEQFRALVEGQSRVYLVIDPSVALRRTLANAIQKAGGETLEAKDGMDGLMAAGKATGAVVAIAELNMPVMDGLEFMRQFRSDKRYAGCPVILMSSENKKERILAAVKGGANAYLKKPFDPPALVEKLQSLKLL